MHGCGEAWLQYSHHAQPFAKPAVTCSTPLHLLAAAVGIGYVVRLTKAGAGKKEVIELPRANKVGVWGNLHSSLSPPVCFSEAYQRPGPHQQRRLVILHAAVVHFH